MSIFSDWFEHKPSDGDDPDDAHTTVVVKQGDSLWSIAERLHGDGAKWQEIADANPDKQWSKDYVIQPGEELRVPRSWL